MSDFFDELLRGPDDRPQHPDMMKLSDILLRHDGPTTDPTTKHTFNMEDRIAEDIDPEVLTYASQERAKVLMEQLGIPLNKQSVPIMLGISAAWLDAFLVGIKWGETQRGSA